MRNGRVLKQLRWRGLRQKNGPCGDGVEFWQRADVVGVLLRRHFGEKVVVRKEVRNAVDGVMGTASGCLIAVLAVRRTAIRRGTRFTVMEAAGERRATAAR